ncbi:MAG: ABC transporter permease, partial [Bacteroidota bacterium]
VDGLDRASSLDEILVLMAINVSIITLSFLLFPYLWRS